MRLCKSPDFGMNKAFHCKHLIISVSVSRNSCSGSRGRRSVSRIDHLDLCGSVSAARETRSGQRGRVLALRGRCSGSGNHHPASRRQRSGLCGGCSRWRGHRSANQDGCSVSRNERLTGCGRFLEIFPQPINRKEIP